MKKLFTLILTGMMILTASACSSDKNSSNSSTDNSLKDVKDKGELVLGLDDSFPPMGFQDADGNIIGFDIDLANEVASRMGVQLKLQPIVWSTNISQLNSKNIDCVWNGMSINDERKEKMLLSEAYMKNRMVLVVTNKSGINSSTELKGKVIGVQNGSTAHGILEESNFKDDAKEITGFTDNLKAFLALESGGIDSLFIDEVFAEYYIESNKKDFKILDDGALADEEYAIGFRTGDTALRNEVQKILSEMKADGKVAEISQKWFGEDISTIK